MSDIPNDLKYTKSHEWVRVDEDGSLTVGITDHAQDALGDLVYVEVPEIDASFSAGDACAVVESVKAASDVYCPVSGEILEVNESLADQPELVNEDAYGEGWLMRVQPRDEGELGDLLSAEEYQEFLEEED